LYHAFVGLSSGVLKILKDFSTGAAHRDGRPACGPAEKRFSIG
jgi:hypothetical protein